jgi:hypothetical protein
METGMRLAFFEFGMQNAECGIEQQKSEERNWIVYRSIILSPYAPVFQFPKKVWRPQGDSNPCCRRESLVKMPYSAILKPV